jgi:hypothetical protein
MIKSSYYYRPASIDHNMPCKKRARVDADDDDQKERMELAKVRLQLINACDDFGGGQTIQGIQTALERFADIVQGIGHPFLDKQPSCAGIQRIIARARDVLRAYERNRTAVLAWTEEDNEQPAVSGQSALSTFQMCHLRLWRGRWEVFQREITTLTEAWISWEWAVRDAQPEPANWSQRIGTDPHHTRGRAVADTSTDEMMTRADTIIQLPTKGALTPPAKRASRLMTPDSTPTKFVKCVPVVPSGTKALLELDNEEIKRLKGKGAEDEENSDDLHCLFSPSPSGDELGPV